jgi:hypothetical protein
MSMIPPPPPSAAFGQPQAQSPDPAPLVPDDYATGGVTASGTAFVDGIHLSVVIPREDLDDLDFDGLGNVLRVAVDEAIAAEGQPPAEGDLTGG